MKFEIKSWITGDILFSLKTDSYFLCVQAAVKSGADLGGANLGSADLGGAYLHSAYLRSAYLRGAYLYGANLGGANLSWANLSWANLRSANLRGAYLYGANLGGANLSGANLSGANLSGANLSGANLSGAKEIPDIAASQASILPEGPIIGWKKCRNDVIVKLMIPHKARKSNASGRKCRAEFVKVLQVFGATEGISQYSERIIYRKGETVTCDEWNEDRWVECGGGIHFFITRVEAENYS